TNGERPPDETPPLRASTRLYRDVPSERQKFLSELPVSLQELLVQLQDHQPIVRSRAWAITTWPAGEGWTGSGQNASAGRCLSCSWKAAWVRTWMAPNSSASRFTTSR